jgi:hypothetical protein
LLVLTTPDTQLAMWPECVEPAPKGDRRGKTILLVNPDLERVAKLYDIRVF